MILFLRYIYRQNHIIKIEGDVSVIRDSKYQSDKKLYNFLRWWHLSFIKIFGLYLNAGQNLSAEGEEKQFFLWQIGEKTPPAIFCLRLFLAHVFFVPYVGFFTRKIEGAKITIIWIIIFILFSCSIGE